MAGARTGTTASKPGNGSRSAPAGKTSAARTASDPEEHRRIGRPAKHEAQAAAQSPRAADPAPNTGAPRQPLGYLASRRIKRAYDTLLQDRVAKGTPDLRVSARVDPGILEAAARNLGLTQPSDVVNAAIIAAAAQDPFKAWFLTAAGTLPDEFELAV